VPLFCRHNRYTAECPICSKGTVLDQSKPARRSSRSTRTGPHRAAPGPAYKGRAGAAGPYPDEDGTHYVVRFERVPGGLRLAEWADGSIRRRAPVLAAADLPALVGQAEEAGALKGPDAARLRAALEMAAEDPGGEGFGASPGRSGEMRDELRVEALVGGMVRIGRWLHRPHTGFELQAAPVMLPVARYAEALAGAARGGLLSGGPAPARQ
jgi:hypothetical protein